MLDSMGVPLQIGEWVAFYKSAKGKAMLGQILSFNTNTMLILPQGKKGTVRKSSAQVVKVSSDLIQEKKIVVKDSVGVDIVAGDWVALTSVSNNSWGGYGEFQGKMMFGEIKKLNKSSVYVQIPNRKTTIRKLPNQVVRVSEEQMTLKYFSA